MMRPSLSVSSRNWCPFQSVAWKYMCHWFTSESHLSFWQNSQEVLQIKAHAEWGFCLVSLSTLWCGGHSALLRQSQNITRFSGDDSRLLMIWVASAVKDSSCCRNSIYDNVYSVAVWYVDCIGDAASDGEQFGFRWCDFLYMSRSLVDYGSTDPRVWDCSGLVMFNARICVNEGGMERFFSILKCFG